MKYAERAGNEIIFRSNGETIQITPWGRNSLRVRAAQMADIRDDRFALLDGSVPEGEIEISIGEERGVLRNGKITAVVEVSGWKRNGRLTF